MSSDNPTYTVSDVVTDMEARNRTPGLSTSTYLPWISIAYNILYNRLMQVNQRVKEELFGNVATVPISQGVLETSLVTNIPRFGGFIKVEVLYGGTNDARTEATRLRSESFWANLNNVSTSYQPKTNPLYYLNGGNLGLIPVPPESGCNAYVYYIKRATKLDSSTDQIDIPYRYIYPILTYVQARLTERLQEDFFSARFIDERFAKELDEVCMMAESEYNENDGTESIEYSNDDQIHENPLGGW